MQSVAHQICNLTSIGVTSPSPISFEEIGHEIISTAILSLLLIQLGHLLVPGDSMPLVLINRLAGLTLTKPAQKQCEQVN